MILRQCVMSSTLILIFVMPLAVIQYANSETPHIPFKPNTGQCHRDAVFFARTFCGSVYITKQGRITYAYRLKDKGVLFSEEFLNGDLSDICGEEWIHSGYQRVNLGQVYEGIEIKLNVMGRHIKKHILVKPGASTDQIRVKVQGAQRLSKQKNGDLYIQTEQGQIGLPALEAHQYLGSHKIPVSLDYELNGDEYGLMPGPYNKNQNLIIETKPVIK